ncbi:MAG: ATP-dependent RNA helicase HrpA [Nocardiaceae bacterium]|nr:ATP-dependent RNA helicase HrpA [Nocardiaceae bacterium]
MSSDRQVPGHHPRRPSRRSDPRYGGRLSALTYADAHRLSRRIERIANDHDVASVEKALAQAEARVAARHAAVPEITFPPQLPVSERRDDIAAAIKAHQVVIVAGETGSGKTTQIPKICLELGRGVRGVIGHTQPRRLAARTVAERIAEELGGEIGGVVGYSVRFTDHMSDTTLVRLMTDGILLNEIQRDRMLRRYDTIIIDEAHERSLNIDFLLGYLKQLLPRRPELKVIITSATIDPERFANHFAVDGVPAPIVEVSGRTYPVEIRYRPLTVETDDEIIELDAVDAIGTAVQELFAAGDGDVLVFLSGEREIRDTADALRDLNLPRTEILPLYARLSIAEQHRVFSAHTGRRVVLATNVAETSLTVPGIRYVIDPGTARISRYSKRTKVQRLPIEEISQASARQRSGRCGRVADGISIRLYSEQDFEDRPAFTEPEILRTNLASVILQMANLGLGDVSIFPFVDPPDERNIRDGLALLHELGAISAPEEDHIPRLTPMGRQLARLPVDPRMARILAQGHASGCLAETLIIVSGLSIQDVRERPTEHQQAADTAHARFRVDGSDVLSYLKLWEYLTEQRRDLSSSAFRRMCRAEFLHWLRIREWQDLHGQLSTIAKDLGWTPNTAAAAPDAVHRAVVSGLLSHIGVRSADANDREYLGARGAKFAIFPSSSLGKKTPACVMAVELVETSRLWGRTVARIEPEWAEEFAEHLVKRSYSEPHWSTRNAAAMAYERVSLYGVPIVARRAVNFARIDPEHSRELFIRHALVNREWESKHAFLTHNDSILEQASSIEDRARRRGLVVDEDSLFAFYDKRIPKDVVSGRHFDRWWRDARKKQPDLLDFTLESVINDGADDVSRTDYPGAWRQGEMQFDLTYSFEPGSDTDGVTVRIPAPLIAQVSNTGFDWLVPGMREELVTALIKSLPKHLRRLVVPAPDFAQAALAAMTPRSKPIIEALAPELSRLGGTQIHPSDFDLGELPGHLRMNFAAIAEDGSITARSKNLDDLRQNVAPRVERQVSRATARFERAPAKAWTADALGDVPRKISGTIGGHRVNAYPALTAEPGGVAVRVYSTASQQADAMRIGTRELLHAELPASTKYVLGSMSTVERLALGHNPSGTAEAFIDDCRRAAIDALVPRCGGFAWTPTEYVELRKRVAAELPDEVVSTVHAAVAVLNEWRNALESAAATPGPIRQVLETHLRALVFDGFATEFGAERLRALPRYVEAAAVRAQNYASNAARDAQHQVVLEQLEAEYEDLKDSLPADRRDGAAVDNIRWMLEELRVSLFAQRVGTAYPISEKRVRTAIAEARH